MTKDFELCLYINLKVDSSNITCVITKDSNNNKFIIIIVLFIIIKSMNITYLSFLPPACMDPRLSCILMLLGLDMICLLMASACSTLPISA